MDNSLKFENYRKKYKEFWYNNYCSYEDEKTIYLEYEFEIPGLTKFKPKLSIEKKNLKLKDIKTEYSQNMIFNIGMIELISYWKSTCAPRVIIKCGYLDKNQIDWWKKLYFYGLGELFYRNNIKTDINNFMNIKVNNEARKFEYDKINSETYQGGIAGINDDNIIEIHRTIDKNLIDLNEQGAINGHTPFSAMLAFVSYFIAYLLSKKYVALSNENSANESNILGEKINHQYSKSFEFECDFENYTNKYLKAPVKYFSFLRPLNELQIAKIFAKHEKYHSTFKSCNVGSKDKEWKWCCNCA